MQSPYSTLLHQALATAAFALFLNACTSGDDAPLAPETPALSPATNLRAAVLLKSLSQVRTYDDELEEVSKRVRGFGGWFVDSNGEHVAYLSDRTRDAQLRALLDSAVRRWHPSLANRPTTIRTGRFDFSELREWKRDILSSGPRSGFAFADIDETANVVRIGVADGNDRRVLSQWIASRGIPPGAVLVEVSGPVELHETVDQTIRPTRGGTGTGRPSLGNCTLGFNALVYSLPGRFMVVNSHCTPTIGINDFSIWYQRFNGPRVGVEFHDPPWFDNETYWNCRGTF